MEEDKKPAKKKKSRRGLIWKIPLISLGVIVGLIIAILAAISFMLTPERLTKLVEDYGSEYLECGQVEAERVEIFVWSTFPHVELQVDDLKLTNLHPDIPEEYRTVAGMESFTGRLDIVKLLSGTISIDNIELVRPHATVWEGAEGVNSLSILPVSAEEEQEQEQEQTESGIPDIKLSRMVIEGDGTFHYVAPAKEVDASVTLERIEVESFDELPTYALRFNGNFGMAHKLKNPLNIGIDGSIGWNPEEPYRLDLDDFKINLDELEAIFSTRLSFQELFTVETLDMVVDNIPLQMVNDVLALTAGNEPLFESNAKLSLSARLHEPYMVNTEAEVMKLPVMHVEARLSDAPLEAPQFFLQLENLGMEVSADIAETLEASTVELKRLQVKFPAADFTANGTMSKLGQNPKVNGSFRGLVNFSRMNPRVWQLIGMKMKGRLNANVDFNLRFNDLTPHTFHRTRLTGSATLNDFLAYMPDDSIAAGLNHAQLSFGSSRSFTAGEMTVDSLLSVSFKVDSAWMELPEMNAQLSGLAMGLGIENKAASSDSSTVTPMGGGIRIKTLRYRSQADSTRAILRNLAGGVSIRRYNGENRAPQVGANLNVGRVFCSDRSTRISLRDARVFASGHYTSAAKRSRRPLSAADSIRMRARRDSALAATANFEQVDFGVDRSAVSLLRRWHVSGGVTAERGRYASPTFPLRTSLHDLDFSFNADSLILKQLNLRAGQTDFALSGTVSNIQRAMGRRAGAPLKLNLKLRSDTLNVNEITQALFKGAGATVSEPESASEEISDEELAAADTLPMMAPVIPMNIDAKFLFNAKNVVYSTMLLQDFKGEVMMAKGAAHLRNLHAASPDLGSVTLNMLYYAPTRTDVNFGLGLDLNRFNIGNVGTVVPAIDTIMPMLNTMAGVVDLKITATTPVDSMLNVELPQMKAMLSIAGDSLTLIDPETFKSVSKWLMFKNKNRNLIEHIEAQLVLEDNTLSLYPFMFDFDRYRLGVMGHNDLDMNLDYHVAVMKSPLPFSFGINVKGSADNMKIRLGKARFKEEMAASNITLSDTVRMNLAREMLSVFARGTKAARLAPLRLTRPKRIPAIDEKSDTLSASDSLYLRQEGLIEIPDSIPISTIQNR